MAEILPFPVRPSSCPRCQGIRWVCEEHPAHHVNHDGCRGAGEPCPICNAGEPPDLPEGFESFVTHEE